MEYHKIEPMLRRLDNQIIDLTAQASVYGDRLSALEAAAKPCEPCNQQRDQQHERIDALERELVSTKEQLRVATERADVLALERDGLTRKLELDNNNSLACNIIAGQCLNRSAEWMGKYEAEKARAEANQADAETLELLRKGKPVVIDGVQRQLSFPAAAYFELRDAVGGPETTHLDALQLVATYRTSHDTLERLFHLNRVVGPDGYEWYAAHSVGSQYEAMQLERDALAAENATLKDKLAAAGRRATCCEDLQLSLGRSSHELVGGIAAERDALAAENAELKEKLAAADRRRNKAVDEKVAAIDRAADLERRLEEATRERTGTLLDGTPLVGLPKPAFDAMKRDAERWRDFTRRFPIDAAVVASKQDLHVVQAMEDAKAGRGCTIDEILVENLEPPQCPACDLSPETVAVTPVVPPKCPKCGKSHWCDDNGDYHCHECGHRWPKEETLARDDDVSTDDLTGGNS